MAPHCHVLLVEDHESSRQALEQLLQRFGFDVCAVGTLADAQAALDGQDAVLLDLNLPDGNGGELLNRIRDERRPMRVAVVSAVLPNRAREMAKDADLYVEKPITPERFTLLVQWLKKQGK